MCVLLPADLPLSQLQAICDKIEDDVYPVLQLEFGVNQRNILGGTSKETVTKALYQELENLDQELESLDKQG